MSSDEMWDFIHKRWEETDRRRAAAHRRRMRWWKHAREYLSLKRLVAGGLVAERPLPDHPPWSHDRAGGSNWWPRHPYLRQG